MPFNINLWIIINWKSNERSGRDECTNLEKPRAKIYNKQKQHQLWGTDAAANHITELRTGFGLGKKLGPDQRAATLTLILAPEREETGESNPNPNE